MAKLIGTGPNQVPTNADLGTMAYVDREHFDAQVGELNLQKYDATVLQGLSNAEAVFVYDTSLDSDGGAWRNRTTELSWYNEGASNTRSSRKEFPAVAVIAIRHGSTGGVFIHDADQPDLPVWMHFKQNASGWNNLIFPLNGGSQLTCVSAKNGHIFAGTNQNSLGLIEISFLEDSCRAWTNVRGYGGQDKLPISERNNAGHTFSDGGGSDEEHDQPLLNNMQIASVDTVVIDSAPLNKRTGLQEVTWTVGTDVGMSVRNGFDGLIYDYTQNHGGQSTAIGKFDRHTGAVIWLSEYGGSRLFYKLNVNSGRPKTDYATPNTTPSDWLFQEHNRIVQFGGNDSTPHFNSALTDGINSSNYLTAVSPAGKAGRYAIGNSNGVDIMQEEIQIGHSRIAYMAHDYSTGWHYGNIKASFGGDLTPSNIEGTEYIDNGAFSTNLNDWTVNLSSSAGGSVVQSGGKAVFTQGTNSVWLELTQPIRITPTETYVLTFDVSDYANGSPNWAVYIGSTDGNNDLGLYGYPTVLAEGTHEVTFTVPSGNYNNVWIKFRQGGGAGATSSLDNVSVRPAVHDRTPQRAHAIAVGTIHRTPVAEGADLCGYSNFTTNNFIQQMHQDYMEVGQSDFCVMHWGKVSEYETVVQAFWEIGRIGSDDTGDASLLVLIVSGQIRFYVRGTGTNESWINTAGFGIKDDGWHHYCYIKQGNLLRVYRDGILEDEIYSSNIGSRNYTDTDTALQLGRRVDGANSGSPLLHGAIALWRFSSGPPPSEEVLRQIYEDERQLFKENAKTGLIGSQDIVRALGYDEGADVLHVGTHSGRSSFKGLTRIDQSDKKVEHDISAANGLVVQK